MKVLDKFEVIQGWCSAIDCCVCPLSEKYSTPEECIYNKNSDFITMHKQETKDIISAHYNLLCEKVNLDTPDYKVNVEMYYDSENRKYEILKYCQNTKCSDCIYANSKCLEGIMVNDELMFAELIENTESEELTLKAKENAVQEYCNNQNGCMLCMFNDEQDTRTCEALDKHNINDTFQEICKHNITFRKKYSK